MKPIEVHEIINMVYRQIGITKRECDLICSIAERYEDRSFTAMTLAATSLYLYSKSVKKKITLKFVSSMLIFSMGNCLMKS